MTLIAHSSCEAARTLCLTFWICVFRTRCNSICYPLRQLASTCADIRLRLRCVSIARQLRSWKITRTIAPSSCVGCMALRQVLQRSKQVLAPVTEFGQWYAATAKKHPFKTAFFTSGIKTSAADLIAQKVCTHCQSPLALL